MKILIFIHDVLDTRYNSEILLDSVIRLLMDGLKGLVAPDTEVERSHLSDSERKEVSVGDYQFSCGIC